MERSGAMNTPDVSVVLCTYNRAAMLRMALESLARQAFPQGIFEVVVVDDGSTDPTPRVVEERILASPHAIRYVRTPEDARGVAQARNLGVATANAPWIAFFDDDQIAEPDWLARLVAAQRITGAVCVGGPIVADLPPNRPTRLGPVCLGLLGEHHYSGSPRPFEGRDLPSTGNLLIARTVVLEAGGFRCGKSGGEDTNLLQQVRQMGHGLYSAPGALVHHVIPPYRVSAAYFRWVSRRWGMNFAGVDAGAHGAAGLAARGLARGVQMLLVHYPRILWAWSFGDTASLLDARCLSWRTEGYLLEAAQRLAPGGQALKRLADRLDFRAERQAVAAGEFSE